LPATRIESAFAGASLYRFLSLAFTYPGEKEHQALLQALEPAGVAASLASPAVVAALDAAAKVLRSLERAWLVDQHRDIFTLSASPDCPLNECAYGAKHIYQEVQALADLAGFYRAFGVQAGASRPDELSAELEFCYLLSLKEGLARERRALKEAEICRRALQAFLSEHLGRWAENVGRRLEALYAESAYAVFGRLLAAFVSAESERLRLGIVLPHQEVPNPPEPIDDEGCPAEEGPAPLAQVMINTEDYLGELTPVGGSSVGEVRHE